jgi:hypothetical protein
MRLAVETRSTRLAVETKFTKLAVDTKFTKLAVDTKFVSAELLRYPTVPKPITVEVS